MTAEVSGNIVDVVNSVVFPGTIQIVDGRIVSISQHDKSCPTFLLPGFVDAHVHIESSFLTPAEFARLAVIHGTVATVSDPHEIANILGISGIEYMIEDGRTVPLKFYFGAPSCVPATPFETSGAVLGVGEIETLFRQGDVLFLSEVMNYPGVIHDDPDVMAKIAVAKHCGKPIDGHAPGLRGKALEKYISAGISTDHETFQYDEGLEKLSLGMKLLIREGSAARNFETLWPLIDKYPGHCMFCSDDAHPDYLINSGMREHVKRAVAHGIDIMTALQCASVNPVRHYNLDVGLLQIGDCADFLEVDSLQNLTVLKTYIKGKVVAEMGSTLIPHSIASVVNKFRAKKKRVADFMVKKTGGIINVIEAIDGQVMTNRITAIPCNEGGYAVSDVSKDILKMAVVNRYHDTHPAVGFVKNFGLKKGAIASSVAHDSHNIVAVGVSDADICKAVNLVITHAGGIAVASGSVEAVLPLPVAGIMSNEDGFMVARHYARLNSLAKDLGATQNEPFMTLSFMALLVIPKLKLSDRGLFDSERFQFINLFEG